MSDYLSRIDSLVDEAAKTLDEMGRVDLATAIRFKTERDNCITLDQQEA